MSTDYTAPLDDIDFVLRHIADLQELSQFESFEHVDVDETRPLLEEAGRFFSEVVAPTNRVGDLVGSQWSDGAVKTPDEFAVAYKQIVDSGWCAVPFSPEIGGGGFPWLVGLAIQEMLTSANMALSLCPLLTQGAIHALEVHGSEEQRMTWLPKLTTGEWSGTMNLTEPQAGSDVGAVAAKATDNGDGSWAISGQKIYITYGEHDMSDNIVHLVLARTPGAAPGTRGISLFLVPKFILNTDGTPGDPNSLSCLSIEHKLGIHGSPTCVMSFDDAQGWMIGDEQTGMASMFTMMNSARLSVGLEGLAVAERAYQQALGYAQERMQGGRPDRGKGEQAPIIEHPDVRRMLLTMKSSIEAMRCLTYLNAKALDVSNVHTDAEDRERARELAELLTPLSKSWCTDLGNELTSLNVQVHGGMGFIEETGAAQHYRDIRIGAIYEGTNGIQALDLLGRKLPMRGGAVMMEMLDTVEAEANSLPENLKDLVQPLLNGTAAVRETSQWLGANMGDDAMAGATPYLRLVSTVVGAWLMAKSGRIASEQLANGSAPDAHFAEQKMVTARFFVTQLLPAQVGLAAQVTAGNSILADFAPTGA